ncbi:pilus assembly protein TadE [Janthinobacterium sp. BJB412]|nr:pilus assembly protein TadE [Janthinobacterium sp. BJB412]
MRNNFRRQTGAGSVVVEFAIVLLVFLMLAFGVMELARVMYLFNTLQEVTRHAAMLAANTDFKNEVAKSSVRQAAIFRSSPGSLILGAPITDAYVRIDYMSLVQSDSSLTMTEIPTTSLPACSANNRITCTKDRNDPVCIRFVRVRICDPGDTDTCAKVQYQALSSIVNLPVMLPKAEKIVPAESLGLVPGMAPCL